jgi:hypothetical protein
MTELAIIVIISWTLVRVVLLVGRMMWVGSGASRVAASGGVAL